MKENGTSNVEHGATSTIPNESIIIMRGINQKTIKIDESRI